MSTGSIASDAEDCSPCQRRTTRGAHCHNSPRCTDYDEEEFDDPRVHGKAKPQATAEQLSDAPPGESRQCQRNAANARERARMRVLSKGFSRLKTTLPWVPADTKLSKLDTLRLASSYISHLRQLLQDERFGRSFVHPVNLVGRRAFFLKKRNK